MLWNLKTQLNNFHYQFSLKGFVQDGQVRVSEPGKTEYGWVSQLSPPSTSTTLFEIQLGKVLPRMAMSGSVSLAWLSTVGTMCVKCQSSTPAASIWWQLPTNWPSMWPTGSPPTSSPLLKAAISSSNLRHCWKYGSLAKGGVSSVAVLGFKLAWTLRIFIILSLSPDRLHSACWTIYNQFCIPGTCTAVRTIYNHIYSKDSERERS